MASRLQPKGEVFDHVIDRLLAGEAVRVAAPAVLEVVYGYRLRAERDRRFQQLLRWFTRFAASDAFEVVPLDARAAVIAGHVRGASPDAPAKRKGDRRSKAMRQASWLLDIQIAATAFAAGLDVATDNRSDFESLAELLAGLFPDAPALAVVSPPV